MKNSLPMYNLSMVGRDGLFMYNLSMVWSDGLFMYNLSMVGRDQRFYISSTRSLAFWYKSGAHPFIHSRHSFSIDCRSFIHYRL